MDDKITSTILSDKHLTKHNKLISSTEGYISSLLGERDKSVAISADESTLN